jgi:hypothetical protein
MNKSEKVLQATLLSHDQATEVVEPGKEALDFPTPFVAAQLPPILCSGLFAVATMRRDHLDALFFQLLVKRVAIVSAVSNEPLWSLADKDVGQSFLHKGDFMRRSRCCVDGDRKTSAIRHCHELATFAPLGLSHSIAPFLAPTKEPSMKHSLKSKPPRSLRSAAKVSKTWRSVPSCTHCWKRLWQVWYGGKRGGKSYQRAPLRKTHKMPFHTSRSSRRGLPRGLPNLGNKGSINFHCSSLSSSRRGFLSLVFWAPVMHTRLTHPF